MHGDAKAKVESSAKVAGRLSGRGGHGLQSTSPATKSNKAAEYLALEVSLRLFGHQFDGAGVVPVHARRDGPTRTANKRKMARVKLQVRQRVKFRPSGGVKRHAIVTVCTRVGCDLEHCCMEQSHVSVDIQKRRKTKHVHNCVSFVVSFLLR